MQDLRTLVLSLGAIALVGCGDGGGKGGNGNDGGGSVDLPLASDAKVVPDAAVCDQLAAAALAQFQSYLPSASTLACQVDSDCTVLWSQSLICVAGCGLLLRTADVPAITAAAAGVCDEYAGAGCSMAPAPCPFGGYGICENGACTTGLRGVGLSDAAADTNVVADVPIADGALAIDRSAASEARPAPDAAVCDELARAARARVDAYLQSTSSLACQVDSDCSLLFVRAMSCFTPCGQLSSTATTTTVTAAIAGECDEYFGAGCPERIVPCLDLHPVCAQGTCVGSPGPPSALDAAVDTSSGDTLIDGGTAG